MLFSTVTTKEKNKQTKTHRHKGKGAECSKGYKVGQIYGGERFDFGWWAQWYIDYYYRIGNLYNIINQSQLQNYHPRNVGSQLKTRELGRGAHISIWL